MEPGQGCGGETVSSSMLRTPPSSLGASCGGEQQQSGSAGGSSSSSQGRQGRGGRRRGGRALLALVLLGAALLLACVAVGVRAAATATEQKQRGGKGGQGKGQGKRKAVVSLTSEELLEHLEFWSTDVALFFYAPWCPYCKLVGPYWDMVGEWHLEQGTKDLLMARFDCERDALATDICVYMGVTHYPTIQFLGAGSYYQNDPLSTLVYGKQNVDRAVFFEGVPDPEVLKDWTNMMRGISQWHRFKERVLGAVGLGGKRTAVLPKEAMEKIRGLEKENRELRDENRWLARKASTGGEGSGGSFFDEYYSKAGAGRGGRNEDDDDDPWAAASAAGKAAAGGDEEALERYYEELMKSLETGHGANGDEPASAEEVDAALDKMAEEILGPVRGQLGHGDPFEELAGGALGEAEQEVVLACVGDFAGDYCRELDAAGEAGTEPYCELLPDCVAQGFAPQACRPARCPFKADGCERIRNCLRGGVMDLYAQMVPGAGGAAPVGVDASGAAAAAGSSGGGSGSGEGSASSSPWGGWFGGGGGKQGAGGAEL